MGSQLDFKVSGVRNPRSTKPLTDLFELRTYTAEGFAIDKGSMQASDANDLEITPGQFTAVELLEPDSASQEITTGEVQTTYLLSVSLNNGLIADRGSLLIDFPEQV